MDKNSHSVQSEQQETKSRASGVTLNGVEHRRELRGRCALLSPHRHSDTKTARPSLVIIVSL